MYILSLPREIFGKVGKKKKALIQESGEFGSSPALLLICFEYWAEMALWASTSYNIINEEIGLDISPRFSD